MLGILSHGVIRLRERDLADAGWRRAIQEVVCGIRLLYGFRAGAREAAESGERDVATGVDRWFVSRISTITST